MLEQKILATRFVTVDALKTALTRSCDEITVDYCVVSNIEAIASVYCNFFVEIIHKNDGNFIVTLYI